MFDSDDILIKNALENLFKKNVKNNLDIIFFNSKLIFDDKIYEKDYLKIFIIRLILMKILKIEKKYLKIIKRN